MNSAKSGMVEPSGACAAAACETRTKQSFRTLPHEWAFGAFLLSVALRLSVCGNALNPYTLLFWALFVGGIGLSVWTTQHPSRLRWTIRLLWYPSIMGVSFYALTAVIPLLGVPDANARLASWDLALLGQPAAEFFVPMQSPRVTDVLVAAYSLFFFYLILGPAWYCINDMSRFRSCIAGLFTLYAMGLTGYTLLPAQDPLFTVAYRTELPGGVFSQFMLSGINSASNGFDVFPSIHVAVTLYLLMFDFRHFRRRFWLALLPCVALWISTVYLRYHYLVDVFAGVTIAGISLFTAVLYERSPLARQIDQAAACVDAPQGAGRPDSVPAEACAGTIAADARRRIMFVMRLLIALIIVLAAVPATADVYRWTDKDGVVHYTDKPPEPGAKPAQLPPLQTFKPDTPPTLPGSADIAKPAAKIAKVSMSITTPVAEETIRDGEGKIPVSVTAVPQSGEGIVYTLDGAVQNKEPTPSSAYLLTGVERGEHSIGASLVDASGKTLATAAPVTVYVMPPTVKR